MRYQRRTPENATNVADSGNANVTFPIPRLPQSVAFPLCVAFVWRERTYSSPDSPTNMSADRCVEDKLHALLDRRAGNRAPVVTDFRENNDVDLSLPRDLPLFRRCRISMRPLTGGFTKATVTLRWTMPPFDIIADSLSPFTSRTFPPRLFLCRFHEKLHDRFRKVELAERPFARPHCFVSRRGVWVSAEMLPFELGVSQARQRRTYERQ